MKRPEQLSYDDQLNKLERLGVNMEKTTRERNIETLESIGYYKLKEFAMPYNISDTDDIKFEGITFKLLISRYYQDKNLRMFILAAIQDIEIKMKSSFAFHMGQKYGPYGYLDFRLWCNRNDNSKFEIEEKQYFFKKDCYKNIKKSNLPDLQYPRNLNSDNLPTIWLITDALTFGDVVYLLGIMSKNNLKLIAEDFNCKSSELLSWLKCLNLVRNLCCHNDNMIDLKLKTRPMIPDEFKEYIYNSDGIYSDRIALPIFIIKKLMNSVNPRYKFNNIRKSLYKIANSKESLAHDLGFKSVNSISKI